MSAVRSFKNCSILVCGLLLYGTPLEGVFDNRDYVIFDLSLFRDFIVIYRSIT